METAVGEFERLDLVLVTHIHKDHFDAAAVVRHFDNNPAATLISTPEVIVELVNETGLTVDANFFISADASDEGGLFVSGNLFTEYSDRPIPTLGARMTVSFALACDRIRSMGVSRPVFVNTLTFTGGVSPDQIIFLRESDYACGDTLRFVYFAEDDVFHVRLERP